MGRKKTNFNSMLESNSGYQTFTMYDEYRALGNETIIMRATLYAKPKAENFSEFIRNLIVEENERLKAKIKGSV